MIISASRRTDIPALYSRWFINRMRAGYCHRPQPVRRTPNRRISLAPEDVDAIVFWTRNPRPLFRYLDELDARGYRYYFQYTLLDNPRLLDEHNPPQRRRWTRSGSWPTGSVHSAWSGATTRSCSAA